MSKKQVAMRYINNEQASYSVDWYMTKRCNFCCSYCAEYLHDYTSEHPSLVQMKKLVDIITNKHQGNVLWSLTGGEPMIIPHIQDILKHISKADPANISITTNGSGSIESYIEAYNNGLHNITLSMHFEFIENQIEEYIDKIIKLEEYRKKWNNKTNNEHSKQTRRLLIRFMVYPGTMDLVDYMHEKLLAARVEKIEFRNIRPQQGTGQDQMPTKKLDMNFDHSKITDKTLLHDAPEEIKIATTTEALNEKLKSNAFKNSELIKHAASRNHKWYSSEEKTKINNLYTTARGKTLECFYEDGSIELKHYNELTMNRNNNFQGFMCWAGSMAMKISPLGDIYVGSCHVGGKLGNIFNLSDSFVLPDDPIICPKTICSDNLDLRVPKVLPGYEHLIGNYVNKK